MEAMVRQFIRDVKGFYYYFLYQINKRLVCERDLQVAHYSDTSIYPSANFTRRNAKDINSPNMANPIMATKAMS